MPKDDIEAAAAVVCLDPVTLPGSFQETEKGNTWLHNEESHVLWIELEPGPAGTTRYLEVTYTPGNSPGWYVQVNETTPEAILAHVHKNLGDWWVGRWNLPLDARTRKDGGLTVIVGDEDVEDEDVEEEELP